MSNSAQGRDRSRSQQGGRPFQNLNDDVTEHEIINNRYIPPKGKKPPPITIFDINIVSLRNKLSTIKEINSEKLLIRLTQHGTKIFTQNNTDFNMLKEYCKQNKISCYTHTLHDDRKIKICLYGLYKMNTDILKKELHKHNVKPSDIKIIEKRNQNVRYPDDCIYLLYFPKKDNIRLLNLRSIPGLFNIKVSWKYYTPKSHGPTQCSNCQDFGHGTENCLMKPKCIRCGDQHSSSTCPLMLPNETKIPTDAVKCANCGQGHTANFKGCNYRKQYITMQEQFKPKNRTDNTKFRYNDRDFPQLINSNDHQRTS